MREKNTVQYPLRMPEKLLAELKVVAEEEGRSVADVMRRILEEKLRGR